jgi:hypothetical protein
MAKPFLMGAEVEYSMPSVQPHRGVRFRPFHNLLLDAMRAEHAWLPDIRSPHGIYIDNGSRYYLDAGNHNEFSSPELSTPRQIAVYDRANEQTLRSAKAKMHADGIDICITKHNINFSMPDRASWGQHEAYTCWIHLEQAAPQLIPHLVSRVPYAGAGYLSAHADGIGFELSQRARHMTRNQGVETTHSRAIFCTRAWKSSDVSAAGWTRTNLISKDSQRCSFGMYLTYGVTGLLFMIMNEGLRIGRDVQLKDPVAAMRAISLDPWLRTKVVLANGKQATAIDIQRAYLCEAQRYVESGDYPDWADEVLEYWSATLDQLERDPLQLADRLDTYLKLTIFNHQLTRASLTWATLRQALTVLDWMRRTAPEFVVAAVLNENMSGLDSEQTAMCQHLSKNRDLKRVGLDRLRFAVRLQAVELNYHELGGLFDQLDAAGQIDPVVVSPEEVQHAIHHPPPGGRAEARSKSIYELQGQPWACDWQCVVNQTEGKWFDLRDPFTNKREVTPLDASLVPRRHPSEIADILVRIAE